MNSAPVVCGYGLDSLGASNRQIIKMAWPRRAFSWVLQLAAGMRRFEAGLVNSPESKETMNGFRRSVAKVAGRIASWAASESKGVSRSETLAPLTSNFDPEQHQLYVDYLNRAVRESKVKNIALTGRYGAGKSSVLEAFGAQDHLHNRVLFLALSTLGPAAENETRTNQIEKELVKQLLHRERPARLPQSRYHRIRSLPRTKAVFEAVGALIALAVLAWLLGAGPNLPGLDSDQPFIIRWGAMALSAVVLVGLVARTRMALHNRFLLAGVSAVGTSISLADNSDSYFDQYLDEIVYFFETVAEVDIVIFEDLDRFDDPGIFEALRELNTLLNNSKQTDGRTIRFVFALRDSIFERLGYDTQKAKGDAADAEAVRANRTKFFDLVVPIVPFITHRNARDLLTRLLAGTDLRPETKPSLDLVDLVSKHLPDMRLLTNVVNEYSVFSRRLIVDGQGIEGLEADQLFAMVVYKNIHLADFEQIQLGRSNLDELYRNGRTLVNGSIRTRRNRLRQVTNAVALSDALDSRAEPLAATLAWFVEECRSRQHPRLNVSGYFVDGVEFEPEQVASGEFWRALLGSKGGVRVRLSHPNYNVAEILINGAALEKLFGRRIDFEAWEDDSRTRLTRERTELTADLARLAHIDFADLAERDDFTITNDGGRISFQDLLQEHVRSEVGRNLIRMGYIDSHYALYVAQFYGERVPPNAMNFLLQHVEQNRPDSHYAFNNDDEISAVIREAPKSFLSERTAHNISILDYLMASLAEGGQTVLDGLVSRSGTAEEEFLDTYLVEGEKAGVAVARLAARWASVFSKLVASAGLDEETRLRLVDIALANCDQEVDYVLDDDVREFLQASYRELPSLTNDTESSESSSPEGADVSRRAASVAVRAGFVCRDLAAVNAAARDVIIERDAYEMSGNNLRAATGSDRLALNALRDRKTEVYRDAIERYTEYLVALRAPDGSEIGEASGQDLSVPAAEAASLESPWTIDDPTAFSDIVADLAELDHQAIVDIVGRSRPDCVASDLSVLPHNTWDALAECGRFAPTLDNLDRFISNCGGVSSELASLLAAVGFEIVVARKPTTTTGTDAAEDEEEGLEDVKLRVAEAILRAAETIPSPSERVQAVVSLALEDYLAVQAVPADPGPLLGLLVEHDLLADSAESFQHFAPLDWATLVSTLHQSDQFPSFVEPGMLGDGVCALLLGSSEASGELKKAILGRLDEFVVEGDSTTMEEAGRAALATETALSSTDIGSIASHTGKGTLVVDLLDRFGSDLNVDQLLDVLVQVGSRPYSQLRSMNAGDKLDFDRSPAHERVLKKLQVPGRFNVRSSSARGLKRARVRVTALIPLTGTP